MSKINWGLQLDIFDSASTVGILSDLKIILWLPSCGAFITKKINMAYIFRKSIDSLNSSMYALFHYLYGHHFLLGAYRCHSSIDLAEASVNTSMVAAFLYLISKMGTQPLKFCKNTAHSSKSAFSSRRIGINLCGCCAADTS